MGCFLNLVLISVIPIPKLYGEILLEGNLTVGGLFTIYKNENGECSGIASSSVKLLEAVKWTIQQLNEKNYIPGIIIGLDAWPTCQSTAVASDRTIDLIYKIREDKADSLFTKSPLVALIGPNYSDEAETSSTLINTLRNEDRLLQLGFSSTAASLSNTDDYPNFFRVVPSDAVQTEVMVALMVELEWNYVAVIYDDNIYGSEGKVALTKLAKENSICIAASFAISSRAVSINGLQSILRSIVQNTESQIKGVVLFTSERHISDIISVASAMRNEISDQLSFIISESLGLSDSYLKDDHGNPYEPAKGVYVVSPPQLKIDEFDAYWRNIFESVQNVLKQAETNKWLTDIYKLHSDCDPNQNPSCPNLSADALEIVTQTSAWTSYALKAAYIVAKTLKSIHTRLCSGQSGFCNNMKNVLYKRKGDLLQEMNSFSANFGIDFPFVPNALENISLTFESGNDVTYHVGFPDYEAYQYRRCFHDSNSFCFQKIGQYANKKLTIDKSLIKDYHNSIAGNSWPYVNRAQCQSGRTCSSCILADNSDKVFFQDGDLIFGGVVPVYNRGTSSPLSCAEIRTLLGTELVLAIEYATSIINDHIHPFEHIYPGKKIGFVILNSCNQPLLIKNKLITILKDGLRFDNGTVIDIADKMIGWIGPYGSSISVAVSDVLSSFRYIQIAYASTATTLSDRSLYPYFMRVATPDDKQARAMIHIVKHSHYNSDYIQVVFSEGTYGEAGLDALRSAAKSLKVCIANEIKFTDTYNVNSLLEELRVHSFAKIVIIFIMSPHVDAVTSALNKMDYGEFLLIGSEAWGYRPGNFINKPKLAGSVILSLQMPQNDNFTKYLNAIDINNAKSNPWLMEYVQNKFDCYMATSFDKRFSRLCDSNLRLANSISYQQELWTPFVLNAVLVLLSGSSEAFQTLCGKNSASLCDPYKRNPLDVIDKIKGQKLDIDGSGSTVRLFDDNGDGTAGYIIYNLQRNPDNANEVVYKEVGNFPLDGSSIVLNVDEIAYPDEIKLPSTCPNEYTCNACKQENKDSGSIVTAKSEDSNAAVSALGAIVAILVVAIVILVVLFVLFYRRQKKTEEQSYHYIDAVYDPNHGKCFCSLEEIRSREHQCGQQQPEVVTGNHQRAFNVHYQSQFKNNVQKFEKEQSKDIVTPENNASIHAHHNVAFNSSYSETRNNSLNPDSLTKDDYITPYDLNSRKSNTSCGDNSRRSDTELKKVDNDSGSSMPNSSAMNSSVLSQTNPKPLVSTHETERRVPEAERENVVPEAERTRDHPCADHMSESQHDGRTAIVRPLDDSPQLRNSSRRSPQIAVVPGIPKT